MKFLIYFCILWQALVALLSFHAGLYLDGIGAVIAILVFIKILHRFSYHL